MKRYGEETLPGKDSRYLMPETLPPARGAPCRTPPSGPLSILFLLLVPLLSTAQVEPGATSGAGAGRSDPASDPTKNSEAREEFLKINFVFNRKLYELAVPRYRKLLEKYTDFEDKALVEYALALCHDHLAARAAKPGLSREEADALRQKHYQAAVRELKAALSDKKFQRRQEAVALLARCQLGLGDHEGATRSFEWLAGRLPGEQKIAAMFGLAETLYLRGSYPEAVARYREALSVLEKNPPKDPTPGFHDKVKRARYHLGMSLYRSGGDHAREATAIFEQLAREGGSYGEDARYMVALALQESDDAESALGHYRQLLESSKPAWQELALYGMGLALFQLNRHKEVVARLDDLLQRFPQSQYRDAAALYRARALFQLGEIRSAAEGLAALRDSPAAGEEAHLWLARVYASRNRHETAVKLLETALGKNPDGKLRATLQVELATELIALDRFEEAAKALEESRRGSGASEVTQHSAYLHAYCLHRMRKLEESTTACEEFLQNYPRSRYVKNVAQLVAENCFLGTDYARAASYYKAYLQEHGATLDSAARLLARYRLGEAAYFQEDYKEATRLLGELAQGELSGTLKAALDRADPLFGSYHYLLGDAAYRLEDYAGAVRELQAHLARDHAGTPRSRQDARFLLAHSLELQGQLGDARSAYRVALEKDPGGPHRAQIEFELGQIAFQEKDYAQAEKILRALLDSNPQSIYTTQALRLLGWMARRDNRPKDAERWYRRLVDGFPDDERRPEALYGLALALELQSRFEEARQVLDQLQRQYPGNAQASRGQLERGITLAREKRYKEALDVFQKLRSTPLPPDLTRRLFYEAAWCYRRLGRPSDAAAAYSEFLKVDGASQKNDPKPREFSRKVRLELADVELELERPARARDLLRSLLDDQNPKDALRDKVFYQLCWCNYRLEDSDALAEAFENLRREFPASEYLSDSAMLVARSHLARKRHDKAAEFFQLVVEKSADASQVGLAQVSYAECLNEERHFERARDKLSEFLKQNPESQIRTRALFGLGWAEENLGRRDQAVTHYRRAARDRTAKAARAQFQIGQCLATEKKYKDAIVEFLQVPARYSYAEWSARALLQIAGCFEAMEDAANARKYYDEVVQKYPRLDEGRLAKERLARLEP